ncbi:hypothetical protein [Saccharopolyspora griseoalba]|uniref:SPW_0924 family protein n=1 Tax=Saccharopolyspora griseoalba TaxID=1431848 RepID=A0ABW2LLK0_9PSEU
MREAMAVGPGNPRSVLVVCALLCAAVAGLIAVSLLVPGPPVAPALSGADGSIHTAVTPTGSSAG